LGSQRHGWRGVNKLQTAGPIAAAIPTANAHVWNASLLLPSYLAIQTNSINTPPKGHGTLNVVAYFFRWQVETGSLPTN
jgi:hypothetical protein